MYELITVKGAIIQANVQATDLAGNRICEAPQCSQKHCTVSNSSH